MSLDSLRVLNFRRETKGEKHVDWVELANRASFTETGTPSVSTWHRVEKLRPIPGADPAAQQTMHMEAVWSVVGPAHEAWMKGEEIPEHGTPLASWPGVNKDQADILRKFGVRTVEDVAAFNDSNTGKVPLPNMLDIIRAAKGWIENKGAVDMAAKIEDLEAKYKAALELLEKQTAEPVKRGPGRPRKAEAA